MITLRFRSILWFVTGLALAVVLAWWFAAWRAEAAGPGPGESTLVPVTPVRVLDSRDPVNVGLAGPFVSAVGQDLDVTGAIPTTTGTQTVVPEGATGVVLNVTVVEPSADGFVSIRPADAPGVPATSSLNFTAGQIVPNSVTVALPTAGADAGKIEITYDAFGQPGPTTDILIDVVGYTTDGGVAGLAERVSALESELTAVKSSLDPGLAARISTIESQLTAVQSSVDPGLSERVSTVESQVAAVDAKIGTKLDAVSIETVDGQPTFRFTGVNVQVVDGSGDTWGDVNGRGNLIVGYNSSTDEDRSGSHNLVVGDGHTYTSFGGVVFGTDNTIESRGASITAGSSNRAIAPYSSVSGGSFNITSDFLASVVGGAWNEASGYGAVVGGGSGNSAAGLYSSISGGGRNSVNGGSDVIVGGDDVTCNIPSNAGACGEVGFTLPD